MITDMLRRETIIALRARHTAFRIAVDILHPPQQEPPPPVPVMPVLEEVDPDWEAWTEQQRIRRIGHNQVLLGIGLGCFLAFVLLMSLIAYVSHPVPPPPPTTPAGMQQAPLTPAPPPPPMQRP